MKRAILLSMVGVVTLSVYALAQPAGDVPIPQVTPTQAQPQNSMMGGRCSQRMARQSPAPPTSEACPMCEMALDKGTSDATPTTTPRHQKMMARCTDMMRKTGMNPTMMARCMNMMQAPFFLDSPCSIYSQSAKLKLSDQQKAKLIEIQNEARKKAQAVLTPEQYKKLSDIPTNIDTDARKDDGGRPADESTGPTTQPAR